MKRIWLTAIAVLAALAISATMAQAAQPGMRCVQNQLNTLGFDAGTADGLIGAKTRAAAEAYREWMTTTNEGWAQPVLNGSNGQFWCHQISEAHPDVAKFEVDESSSTLLVQFRGKLGRSVGIELFSQRVNTGDCPTPCDIGRKKRVTVRSDANGVGTVSIELPYRATRACVVMRSSVKIASAELFMKSGGKRASAKGGDLESSGRSACSHSQADAKNAATWVLTLE